MSATPFLRLNSVSRIFEGGGGVAGVSLAIERGSFTVLLGPSGCGKSTTLRLIAGLETPDGGSVEIAGRDVTALPPSARGLAMVFQSYALFPHLSVAENIVFGLKVRGVAKPERARRLDEVVALTGLGGLEDRKPASLSGGQRQRVALARAVIAGHPLCLMDEPLSNLDAKLRHTVRQDIRALQRRLGMTVIYVTHDQTEAMGMADIVVLMKEGRIEQMGPPAELYQRPATAFAASFVGSPPMAMIPAHLLPEEDRPQDGASGLVLGLRGEAILLGRPGEGVLPARIQAAEFLGVETFVYCEVEGAATVTARLPGRCDFTPGQAVSLLWAPEDAHWFERDGGQRVDPPSLADGRPRRQAV